MLLLCWQLLLTLAHFVCQQLLTVTLVHETACCKGQKQIYAGRRHWEWPFASSQRVHVVAPRQLALAASCACHACVPPLPQPARWLALHLQVPKGFITGPSKLPRHVEVQSLEAAYNQSESLSKRVQVTGVQTKLQCIAGYAMQETTDQAIYLSEALTPHLQAPSNAAQVYITLNLCTMIEKMS